MPPELSHTEEELPFITTWDGCRNQNPPTGSAEEAKKSAEWGVAVEKPTYDLTIFRLHCGKVGGIDLNKPACAGWSKR